MEFKTDEDKIVLLRTDRDEMGEECGVEHYISYEAGQRLFRELTQSLYECRNFIIENRQVVDEEKPS